MYLRVFFFFWWHWYVQVISLLDFVEFNFHSNHIKIVPTVATSCIREREREMNKKWIVFSCDVKSITLDIGCIVKRGVVKIDKVTFSVQEK